MAKRVFSSVLITGTVSNSSSWSPSPWSPCPSVWHLSPARQILRSQSGMTEVARLYPSPCPAWPRASAASTKTEPTSTNKSGPGPGGTAVRNLENISIYINPFLDSGKACLPATKCEYWTFRHHERKCYLLKSCCVKEAQGFQSGDQYCPGYDA